MDELLRTYVKKRQEQAGPDAELHPAMRKFLQDEVKRTLVAAPSTSLSRENWRAWRWPLVAMWGGIVVLLMMFALINTQMQNLAPAKTKVEGGTVKDERMVSSAERSTASPEVATATTLASTPPALPPTGSLGQATRMARRTAPTFASEFVQVRDRADTIAATSRPTNVLSDFRVRRSGQIVSVTDADGSVYNGQVLSGNSGGGGGFGGIGGRAIQEKAKAPGGVNENVNWSFNVTGTNNSLKQNISFTGSVLDLPMTSAASSMQALAAQNSRIQGRVQVGEGKEFEIEAKPPNP
jgi:hypothetical protein